MTIVHLVGFLFIVVIADARNHEPENYWPVDSPRISKKTWNLHVQEHF
jgi:hypothetical protein